MLYWFPRVAPLLFVAGILAFGWVPTSAEQAAYWVFAVLFTLGLLSLTPAERGEQRF